MINYEIFDYDGLMGTTHWTSAYETKCWVS
jgi:hypothetical protein